MFAELEVNVEKLEKLLTPIYFRYLYHKFYPSNILVVKYIFYYYLFKHLSNHQINNYERKIFLIHTIIYRSRMNQLSFV